jgi:hypothetical protein
MKPSRSAFWIYVFGVFSLGGVVGAFGNHLRAIAGDALFVAAVVSYLLLLRGVGWYAERRRY